MYRAKPTTLTGVEVVSRICEGEYVQYASSRAIFTCSRFNQMKQCNQTQDVKTMKNHAEAAGDQLKFAPKKRVKRRALIWNLYGISRMFHRFWFWF